MVSADPMRALLADPPVLVDEYQRVGGLWDEVKDLVDRDPTPGRVLLTGSAPPSGGALGCREDRRASDASPDDPGAGGQHPHGIDARALHRVGHDHRLLPAEARRLHGPDPVLGFPRLQHLRSRALRTQLDGYLDRIVERDVPEAGQRVRRPATLTAWLRAYGAAVSTPTSWDKIRDAASPGQSAKPAKSTTIH